MDKERASLILDTILPQGNPVADEVERLTMGYEDFVDGQATEIFRGMSQQEIDAVHKIALSDLGHALEHAGHIIGLVNGYNERDPGRTALTAMQDVVDEVETSRTYFQTLLDRDQVPVLVELRPHDNPVAGAQNRVGWGILHPGRGDQRATANHFIGDFDPIVSYVQNPTNNTEAYQSTSMHVLAGTIHGIVRKEDIL